MKNISYQKLSSKGSFLAKRALFISNIQLCLKRFINKKFFYITKKTVFKINNVFLTKEKINFNVR